MIKLTFLEWLTALKAIEFAKKTIKPIMKAHIAEKEIKKNPNFYFLLETESKN